MIGRLAWLFLVLPMTTPAGEVQQHRDPNTGLLSWQFKEPGFSLQLIQVLPDYVAAVYSSRGLPEKLVDRVLEYCVFGTILTNDTGSRLSYRIADWHYTINDGKSLPVKAKSAWIEEWTAMGVPFRWSMLADEQTFEPGDWMQGFITVGLRPESAFDFMFSWTLEGKQHNGKIENVRCAPATPPVP